MSAPAIKTYTRADRENVVQLLYRFHCRAMDEKKFEVAKRFALGISQISRNWRSITDPRKYPSK